MNRFSCGAMVIAWLLPVAALADVDEAHVGQAVERHLPGDEQFALAIRRSRPVDPIRSLRR